MDINNLDNIKKLQEASNTIYDSTNITTFSDYSRFFPTFSVGKNDGVKCTMDGYNVITPGGAVVKTFVIVCKGSQSLGDWVSNFTQFSSSNIDGVPDFIYNNALNMFTQYQYVLENSQAHQVICCGHSRGGGIASYLGYLIAKTITTLNVSVVTFNAVPYATSGFRNSFQAIQNLKAKNFISLIDPLQVVRLFSRSIPGTTLIVELFNPWAYIVKLCSTLLAIPALLNRLRNIARTVTGFSLSNLPASLSNLHILIEDIKTLLSNMFSGHSIDYLENAFDNHDWWNVIQQVLSLVWDVLSGVYSFPPIVLTLITAFFNVRIN